MTNVNNLDDLNPQQKQAATAGDGAILVLAGPGSGKTRVLTHRIAYLIGEKHIRPPQILAVTFTNKAAREMERRVVDLLGSEPRGMLLGTFHSVCARILRREAQYVGITPDFSIFDEDDQLALVKRAMRELNLDDKVNRPASVLSAISNAKNDMLRPDQIEQKSYKDQVVKRVFERYQQLLLACNALDFDDLLLDTARILEEVPAVRTAYAERFEHILVDEFQDTNLAQYTLLRHLSAYHHNIFVVGDEDQSIYRWRGADYRNVLRFEEDYPGYQKILLEQNYRSTQMILDAARAVIDKNPNRTVKRLHTDRGSGERITLYEAPDDHTEAEYVVATIASQVRQKRNVDADFAVMYRTNAQSRVLEEAFLHAGMPYRLVGAQRFYGRREVKDCIAYLRLIQNPADDASLDRIINVPARGIGEKTVAQLHEVAAGMGIPAGHVLLHLTNDPHFSGWQTFSGTAARKLADFGSWLQQWTELKKTATLPELFKQVLEDLDYRVYIEDESDEGQDRWENVEQLLTMAYEYEEAGMTAFLENVALVADQDTLLSTQAGTLPEQRDAPTLLTLHASKGLEFPVVFIIGLDEKVLPHSRSLDDPEQMAEERRLFYVGISRAKDRLYLVRADRRSMYGGYEDTASSRFLKDIPTDLLNASARRSRSGSRWGDMDYSPSRRSSTYLNKDYQWLATNTVPTPKPERTLKYRAGMHVLHPAWGEGLVLESKFIDEDEIVVVNFETVGLKRLDAVLAGLTVMEEL